MSFCNDDSSPSPKTLNLSPSSPPPPPPPPLPPPSSFSSLQKRQNIGEMKREREWRGFLVCTACRGCGAFQTPLLLPLLPPPLCLSLCICLSACLPAWLSVCLSLCLSLCACCTKDLAARQSGLPATTEGTVCTVYLVPAIFFSCLVLSQSSLHVVDFFSSFSFFISA